MKTIGLLGGLGPQATMDLEARIHHVAQRLIPPHFNAGYPPLIVHYCRHAPMVVQPDGTPELPIRPDARLLEAARQIGGVADFLILGSNGAHLLQPAIEAASGRKVLSMIDATLAEVGRRGWRRVGVLGLGGPTAYAARLRELGIGCETVGAELQATLDNAIFRTMEGRAAEFAPVARAAVASLRSTGVDGVIVGCTEIPIMLGDGIDAEPDLINPAALLAEAAVKAALE